MYIEQSCSTVVINTRIITKLKRLYRRDIKLKLESNSFLNFGDYMPTFDQKQI